MQPLNACPAFANLACMAEDNGKRPERAAVQGCNRTLRNHPYSTRSAELLH